MTNTTALIAIFPQLYVPERPPYQLHARHNATMRAQAHRDVLQGGRLRGDVRLMTGALYDYWKRKEKQLEGR